MRVRFAAIAAGSLLGLLLSGLAAHAAPQSKPKPRDPMVTAVEQPGRDLGLVRDVLPPVLQRAVLSPYELTGVADCAGLQRELADLDVALGADVDAPGAEESRAGELAADLISGALSLPFRGVVRQVTGAARRDKAYRRAVAAGMVRRGFLKGRAGAIGCAAPFASDQGGAPAARQGSGP